MSIPAKMKLTQLYTSENQKARFKEYVDTNYSGRLQSMSKLSWLLVEVLIALEEEMNTDAVHDETTFKREFITAIENHPDKRALINFHIRDDIPDEI